MSAASPTNGQRYLGLHSVDIFVRDQERSVRFFIEKLGFQLAFDARLQSGQRWVAVTPPDGAAVLSLVQPKPDSPEFKLIGRSTRVMFVTEDIAKTFGEWSGKGVRFRYAPRLRRISYRDQASIWGQVSTRFEDVDGNTFALVSLDEVSKAVEAQRRAAAQKLEADRRAAYELEVAKEVQSRLFPQLLPACRTLEYAGACIQARQVGGDYFDFLSLGPDKLGLVIGDIAGKGMPAALLMANLQANLRSQCSMATADPGKFFESINQLFYDNTGGNSYATLFFAEYCDRERRLRYVNCGHLSGLLMRNDGSVKPLESTCTVLGLFPEWECSVDECALSGGDILALYTDGITEASNEAGDDFGEVGLLASMKRYKDLPAKQMVSSVLSEVQAFSPHEQHDDITLLVAKCAYSTQQE